MYTDKEKAVVTQTEWDKNPKSIERLIELWTTDDLTVIAITNVLNNEFDLTLTPATVRGKVTKLKLKNKSEQKLEEGTNKSTQVGKRPVTLAPIPQSGFTSTTENYGGY